MGVKNDLLLIALRDLQLSEMTLGTTNDEIMQNMAAYHTQQAVEKIIKQLLIRQRGYGCSDHDLNYLVSEARACGVSIPQWVDDNSYEMSKWATTIRYNSNFRTNRDAIVKFNNLTGKWIDEIRHAPGTGAE